MARLEAETMMAINIDDSVIAVSWPIGTGS
jgi:hypothetical protein